jgi:hypothetical protein
LPRSSANSKRFKGLPYDKIVKAKKIVADGNMANIILLDDGSVCMSGQNHIDGVIAGYNVYALDVARGLQRLRIITLGEYNAFYDWYRKMSAENNRTSDLNHMNELAKKHGYKVVKK